MIIDGKQIAVNRDPEAVKTLVRKAETAVSYGISIFGISKDRIAQRAQVGADLMPLSGHKIDFQKGQISHRIIYEPDPVRFNGLTPRHFILADNAEVFSGSLTDPAGSPFTFMAYLMHDGFPSTNAARKNGCRR